MNTNVNFARGNKNDEFYTQYKDIEKEVFCYTNKFNNAVVYCNCDTKESEFVKFFINNFHRLKLKKIIASNISGEYISFDGDKYKQWCGSEGFQSEDSIHLLKEADIVCTNPPFSLFREYVSQLISFNKNFLIIGNFNAITYMNIFPHIKDNSITLGYSPRNMTFYLPDKTTKTVNACWYTNMRERVGSDEMKLSKRYYGSEDSFPVYSNYQAIEVSKVKDIPVDYFGVMGVPVTYLSKHNPDQFTILGCPDAKDTKDIPTINGGGLSKEFLDIYFKQGNKGKNGVGSRLPGYINKDGNAKVPYKRVFIQRVE